MQAISLARAPSIAGKRLRGRHGSWLPWMLLALAVALRTWQIFNTTVPSRDCVVFVRIAWLLNDHSWREVMQASDRHPGYPIAIFAAAKITSAFGADSPALAMQFAAQLVSAVAGALLVFPTYFLARRWFGVGAAFASSFLLLLVPVGNQLMADGISDGLFLALVVTAVWRLDRAFDRGRLRDFFAGGLATTAAFWVRPEGLALFPVAVVVLLFVRFRVPDSPVKGWIAPFVALALPVAIGVAGFTSLTGRLLVKPTASVLLTDAAPNQATTVARVDCFQLQLLRLQHLARTLEQNEPLAVSASGDPSTEHVTFKLPTAAAEATAEPAPVESRWKLTPSRIANGIGMVVSELFQGTFYYLPLLALAGMILQGRSLRREPGLWLLTLLSAGILGLMVLVAGKLNYVSDRHLLIAIFTMMLWAGAGIRELVGRLSVWLHRFSPRVVAVVVMLTLASPIVPKNILPLHGDRAGFRQAGLWIADHRGPGDQVVDVYGWAMYYSGDAFRASADLLPSDTAGGTVYLIVPLTERRTSIGEIEIVRRLTRFGTEVYMSSSGRNAVAVYAVPMRAVRS